MKKLALVLLVGCSSQESNVLDKGDAKKLLIDRNWIDRMPETKDTRLHVYRFVPTMGGGVFQDRTLYKGTFELFKFSADKGEITFDLPETDDKVTSKFTIEKVDGPRPFDLKLTISDDPRGPHVYFGMRNETSSDLATELGVP